MDIIGTIKIAQEVQYGTSQQGNQYKRQTIVIEYGDRYPKELALTLMNDKCDQYSQYLAPGQQFKFHFDASSREYNGRYYTECMIWKIESLRAQPQQPYQTQQPYQAPAPAPAPMPTAAPMPQSMQMPAAAPAPAPQYQQPAPAPQYQQPTAAPMPNYAPQPSATQQPLNADGLPF